MIDNETFSLLKEIDKREGMQSLSLIPKRFVLSGFQTYTLAMAWVLKKCVISLDTGLGKTIVAGSIINLDTTEKRWLFVCKNSNLIQNASKLQCVIVDRPIQYCTGQMETIINLIKSCVNNSVLIITYDTLNNVQFLEFLFKIRKSFSGIIVDESHNIGNKGSNRSEFTKHIMKTCFEYQYFLTATPLSVDPIQIINQVSMLDPDLIPDPEIVALHHTIYDNGKIVGYRSLDKLARFIMFRYISFTRDELGMKGNYHTKLCLCNCTCEDTGKSPRNITQLRECKSIYSNPCITKLIDIINGYYLEGKRGLVYANLHVYKDTLYDCLKNLYRVTILDGRVSQQDKMQIQQDYNEGKYDILISNLEEGVDLPSDFIVFYELTVKYKQFIGRGERGLSGRDLDIYFILIDKSYEIDFFYNNIYKRSLLLETICGKDISEIKEIEMQLRGSLNPLDLEDLDLIDSYNK